MASARRFRSTYKSAAKSLKRVTAGGLEGIWDTKRCCVSLELTYAHCRCDLYPDGCGRGGWSSHHGLFQL